MPKVLRNEVAAGLEKYRMTGIKLYLDNTGSKFVKGKSSKDNLAIRFKSRSKVMFKKIFTN